MVGKTVSHYKIIEKIGEGGMGVVYKAEDTKLGRFVALKFLPPHLSQAEDEKIRFIHEARAASALDHPNICNIFEIDETEDRQMFIAMACYEGESLRNKINRGPFLLDEAVSIAIQIAQGLAKAHSKQIIHRDIKPANILLTNEGEVKIVDFGLAKLAGRTMITREGTTLGTVGYMSPEQTEGTDVDHRTDIWALGVMLYEMLAGERPFKGDYDQAVMYSIMNDDPKSIMKVNPAVPPEVQQIIKRALQKTPESRYTSADEMLKDLEEYRDRSKRMDAGALDSKYLFRQFRKPGIAVPVVAMLIVIIFVLIWYFDRQAKIRWAKDVALPEIARLIETNWRDFTDAYQLAVLAEKYIPDDPELADLFLKSSLNIDITTEPAGARISMKIYQYPENEWLDLGVSPITNLRVPVGIFRWKMEKEGYETVLAATSSWSVDVFGKTIIVPNHIVRVLDRKGTIPSGMVRVPSLQTPRGKLDDFFIDRYEVTNKQYQEFINKDGYKDKTYWKHEFVREGKSLTWEEAMSEFVDQTGRLGPATWQAGHYPDGQGDYPVGGISWYEAAAYAVYSGKKLPTAQHWGMARGEFTNLIQFPQLGGFAVFAPFSNFSGKGPVAVGSMPGFTSYGAYDMAGNVREWCWNKTALGHIIRGGGWNDNSYRFGGIAQAPAFDRSADNGVRCALYAESEESTDDTFMLPRWGENKDYYHQKPVSDAVFEVYKEQFSYDKSPLNASLDSIDNSSVDWVHERISFDAPYNNERIILHLFLPKNSDPPYQAGIYFPGTASLFHASSHDIANYYEFRIFLSFLVKNGRAVVFPVYKGTFERRSDALMPVIMAADSRANTEYMIQLVQDFKRSIDYLETRKDIDAEKISYHGMSWGGILGAIIPAVDDRIRASILVSGGLDGLGRPEANQINYVGRVTIPTLMLNGVYDTIFPYETSIKPMFDLLGTPAEHKQLKLYETDHIPPMNDMIRESLIWLDRYLGPVE